MGQIEQKKAEKKETEIARKREENPWKSVNLSVFLPKIRNRNEYFNEKKYDEDWKNTIKVKNS